MKTTASAFLCLTVLLLAVTVPVAATPAAREQTTIVVTSTADSGPGTLRRALELVGSGDTITFDRSVFPPAAPATIFVIDPLGIPNPGSVTIDASNAGVILDGSHASGGYRACLEIVNSGGNRIRGLQIATFSGPAIAISGDSQHNVIGGDRGLGDGPVGQGNLLILNGQGVVMSTAGTSFNTVTGNLIGTDAAGADGLGNAGRGFWITEGAHHNTIGPGNVIAHNGGPGVVVDQPATVHNTITQNSIYDNRWGGIVLWDGGNGELAAPDILYVERPAGIVEGTACPACTVELFSDSGDEGATYEGTVSANGSGEFAFSKGAALQGPRITATATDAGGNTSGFSQPNSGGETLVVVSAASTGPGSLHQALQDARRGDTIAFDPAVFPPAAPATIVIVDELPALWRGKQTIDASDAGVILDGNGAPGEWQAALAIVNSSGNVIRGLQISHFTGPAIAISGDAQHNFIGGDRGIGDGPSGQGNVLTQNGTGVVLSSPGTSFNTVSGNLIGTDGTGAEGLGNKEGVWICEGTHDNTIGPDNVIAHNDTHGIEVNDQSTLHNTITQNSIHDNGGDGIRIRSRPRWQLVAPTLFALDLPAGTVTGVTYPHGTVEIFSGSGDEGAVFEGQAVADGTGTVAFEKGAPLLGPHLTATVTDPQGETSEFSLPTAETARSLTLQQGNQSMATRLQFRQSHELRDNGIGGNLIGHNIASYGDVFAETGAKWLRVGIHGQEPEYVDWSIPELAIRPEHDALFSRLVGNGITLRFLLTFWDKATYPGGEGAPCARFKTEAEIEHFLEYVRFIVRHFKGVIEWYTMWNEPDIPNYCPKWIEVEDYINLVKRTVPVIREEDPEAKIVVGEVSTTYEPPAREYLFALLESDIMPLVDGVSLHPMYGPSYDPERKRDYYYGYPSFMQEIKDVAEAHGFDGQYFVDESQWWPAGPIYEVPDAPTVTDAAKSLSRAIVLNRGMDVITGLNANGLTLGAVTTNLCTVMAGAEPAPLPIQMQSAMTSTMSYTFSLADGSHLVALWTDGVAQDFDPGVPATVTVPGLAGLNVEGIDVVHNFQQPILTSDDNGDLVIPELLVKDFPVILRISPTRYTFLPVLLSAPG